MAQSPQYQQYGNFQQPPTGGGIDKTSGMAVTSMILGILGVLTGCVVVGSLLGLIGLILGMVAIAQIGKPGQPMHGKGMAITGVVLGAISVVMVPIGFMMLGILMPAMGAARRTANQMKNSSQLRGLHQSMVIYSAANQYYLPGLDSSGEVLPDGPDTTGNSGAGDTNEARLWILLDGQFVPPEMLANPQETLTATWNHTPVTPAMYSYSLLDIKDGNEHYEGRRAEWMDNANSSAALMSDRNTGLGNGNMQVQSLWTTQAGDWKGNLVWGDNHAEFSTSHTGLSTRYDDTAHTSDSLFENEPTGPNAYMTRD